jgi:hypothetical protein
VGLVGRRVGQARVGGFSRPAVSGCNEWMSFCVPPDGPMNLILLVSETFGPCEPLAFWVLRDQGSWNLRMFRRNAFRSIILWFFGIDPAQCFQPGSKAAIDHAERPKAGLVGLVSHFYSKNGGQGGPADRLGPLHGLIFIEEVRNNPH